MNKVIATAAANESHTKLSIQLLKGVTFSTLVLGVTFWASWSVTVVLLAQSNASLSSGQLMSLVALAGASGVISRLLGILLVNILGRWMPTVIAAVMVLISMVNMLQFSTREITYSVLAGLATLSGVGCAMFASAFELTRQSKTAIFSPLSTTLVIGMTLFSLFLAQLIVPLLVTWQPGKMESFLVLERSSGNVFARVDAGGYIFLNSFSLIWASLFALIALVSIGLALLTGTTPSQPKVTQRKRLLQNKHLWYCSILYNMTFGSFIGLAMTLPLVLELVFGYSTLILVWMGPFIAFLGRSFGRWLAGVSGSAFVTQTSLLLMLLFGIFAGRYMYLAQHGAAAFYFEPFFISTLGLIFTSAVGNGSVTATMTKIFARTDTPRVLTWAGTVAMLGAVYLPLRFVWAFNAQSVDTVYIDFIVFYTIGLVLNGFVYLRRYSEL